MIPHVSGRYVLTVDNGRTISFERTADLPAELGFMRDWPIPKIRWYVQKRGWSMTHVAETPRSRFARTW